jgi:hypothetical protein
MLHIDAVTRPCGGVTGMGPCPARRVAGQMPRDLARDLASIEARGASTLLSLVEAPELARRG